MAITGRQLQAAIAEAERFLARARALELHAAGQIDHQPNGVINDYLKYSGAPGLHGPYPVLGRP